MYGVGGYIWSNNDICIQWGCLKFDWFLYDTYKQSSLTCCTSLTSNPLSDNKWWNFLDSVIYYFLVLSGVCANFPRILLRQSFATARRHALNEMSSGHKVILSWARTRSMYLFFLVCITLRRVTKCFQLYIYMVFIYCANCPPSPVLVSYLVIVSYCHTSYTFNKVYPICTAFWNSTDTQVPERSIVNWMVTYYLILSSAHFLHNTNINFLWIWEGSIGL